MHIPITGHVYSAFDRSLRSLGRGGTRSAEADCDKNLYPRENPNESFAFCACIVCSALDRCLDHGAAGPGTAMSESVPGSMSASVSGAIYNWWNLWEMGGLRFRRRHNT